MQHAEIALDTGAIRRQIAQAFETLHQGRTEEAAPLSAALLLRHPQNPEVLFLACEVQLAIGDLHAALGHITEANALVPGQLPLLLKQAHILTGLRRRNAARELAQQAIELAGNNGADLWAIAGLYSRLDDPASAKPLYERALAAGSQEPALRFELATCLLFTGDVDAAEQHCNAVLAVAPRAGHVLQLRSTLRKQTAQRNHVAELEARLRAGLPDPASRAACFYALAKELEDLGQYDRSFAALSAGASLKRSTVQYDSAAESAAIAAISQTYTAAVMQAANTGQDEPGPIFIVGMPRTGTTLVERMLSQHNEVSSAGELWDFAQVLNWAARSVRNSQPDLSMVDASLQIDFAEMGRDYLEGARQAAAGTRWFIDKMPVNFMYCGLIRKALPQARIIHLVRDPMDTCYAIYKTLFNQAFHFSYDLQELADYYISYQQTMRHWHSVMPGQILDVHYEDLVQDLPTQARRISDWCGLDWQDALLNPAANDKPSTTASAAQIRQPVHTASVQKWREYAVGLEPLRARLVAAGIVPEE